MRKNYRQGMRVLVLVLLLLVHHTLLTVVQNVLPFPKTFAREKTVGTSYGSLPPVTISDGQFAFFDGQSILVMQAGGSDPAQKQRIPIPDPTFRQATDFFLTDEIGMWIADNNLILAQRNGTVWGKPHNLGTAVAFDVRRSGDSVFVVASDDKELRITDLTNGDQEWSSIRIQDVTRIETAVHSNGNLLILSLADYGSAAQAFWWTEWNPLLERVVRQSKILVHNGGGRIGDFEFGLADGVVFLFYPVESKGKHTQFFAARFPLDHPGEAHPFEVVLDRKTTRVADPQLRAGRSGEFDLALVADGRVVMLHFQQEKISGLEWVTVKDSKAIHPVFVNGASDPAALVWIVPAEKGYGVVKFSGSDPEYRKIMNRIQLLDIVQAMQQLPRLLGGAVYVLAASFKWILLPLSYFAVVWLVFRFSRSGDRKTMGKHYWMAVAVYLASKLIFVGQLHSPETVPHMPGWMIKGWSRYWLPSGITLLTLWANGSFRKRQAVPEFRWFLRFLAVDLLLSLLWYGYFIR